MFQTLLKNKIMITVLVLVVGAVGYYLFFAPDTSTIGIVSDEAIVRDRDAVLAALSSYNDFNFTSTFTDSIEFDSLVDMTSPIPDQVPGRTDPFAPAGL